MRLIDADELIEHVWRDRLDSRERIANLVKSMPSAEPPTSLYTDGFKDGYRQGFKDAQEQKQKCFLPEKLSIVKTASTLKKLVKILCVACGMTTDSKMNFAVVQKGKKDAVN